MTRHFFNLPFALNNLLQTQFILMNSGQHRRHVCRGLKTTDQETRWPASKRLLFSPALRPPLPLHTCSLTWIDLPSSRVRFLSMGPHSFVNPYCIFSTIFNENIQTYKKFERIVQQIPICMSITQQVNILLYEYVCVEPFESKSQTSRPLAPECLMHLLRMRTFSYINILPLSHLQKLRIILSSSNIYSIFKFS